MRCYISKEYDIPDDLPNRRTGHGHGSYPAADPIHSDQDSV